MTIPHKIAGLRRQLYSQLFDLLGERGLSTLYAPRFAGVGVILMFHRVMLPAQATLYPGYTVSTTTLEASLKRARRAGWRIVSLDEMREALLSKTQSKERFACFTFDDGYEDNLMLALPIFRKYQAPMNVYVCTGMIERTMFYWWGALEYLILSQEEIVLDLPNHHLEGRRVSTVTAVQKLSVFHLIDGWSHANSGIAADVLRRMFQRYDVDDRTLLNCDALSEQQLRELGRDPLVTIGSHGLSHRRMNLMPEKTLKAELTMSRRWLESATGSPVVHLSYPFGARDACGRREFEAAETAGYATAVTSRRGNLFPEHRSHLFSLPRREASPIETGARNALYGVTSILRRDPLVVID